MRANRWFAIVMGGWLACATPLAAEPESLILDQLAHQYTTPDAIASFLATKFTFDSDQAIFGEADHWQQPVEFLNRGKGDCEDYAMLARELLRRNWIKAEVFSIYGANGFAHTVCIFLDSHGLYNVIDQGMLLVVEAETLQEVASALCPNWTTSGITQPNGMRGQFVSRLENHSSS